MRLCDFTSMLTLRCFRKDNIAWECENGGQLWTDSVTSGYDNGTSFPTGFCASGFSSLYAAFIGGLLVDLVFQVCTWWWPNNTQIVRILSLTMFGQMYMLFLNWRFSKRLEHYREMKGPFFGGTYNSHRRIPPFMSEIPVQSIDIGNSSVRVLQFMSSTWLIECNGTVAEG